MPGGIFLLDPQGELTEMSESPFAAELDFQELLARHPNLLAGDQIDPGEPRRWLLVTREVGIPDDEGAGARWSLDHLFLDQDGVPTLVEVKRGRDPRVRREVVAQMLDYASHAVLFWTAEAIRTWFEARCRQESRDPEELLRDHLAGDAPAADFWQRVATNLQAGKIRLLFVADAVPPELRRIVEFLNRQMTPAEVLALEIRQYVGGPLRTLVPRLLGQTVRKETASSSRGATWDEPRFLADLAKRCGDADLSVAQSLLDWARRAGCRIWWGNGHQDGSFFPLLDHAGQTFWTISVWTYGRVEIQFQEMLKRAPFQSEASRLALLERFNAVPGIAIPRNRIEKRPSVPLQVLRSGEALGRFLGVLDWMVGEIRGV
jgi:hypothetical protein